MKSDKKCADTLCESCVRGALECPWLRSRIPIPGWTAEPTVVRNKGIGYATYKVNKCPGYKQDDRAIKITARRKYAKWSKQDLLILLQLHGKVTYKEIAGRLDRDVESINQTVKRLKRRGIL